MDHELEQIAPETAALLAAQAQAQGLSIDAYLQTLLGMPQQNRTLAALSDEEFEVLMTEFAQGTAHVPALPTDFSRKDIYFNHD